VTAPGQGARALSGRSRLRSGFSVHEDTDTARTQRTRHGPLERTRPTLWRAVGRATCFFGYKERLGSVAACAIRCRRAVRAVSAVSVLCPCCVRVFMSVEAFFVYLLLGNARPAAQNDVCRYPEFPLISFADHCLTERDKKRRGPSPPPHVLHVIRNRRQVPNGSQLVGRLRALHSSCGIGMRCGTWPPGTPGSMVPSKL